MRIRCVQSLISLHSLRPSPFLLPMWELISIKTVSYTHLDVYKRQILITLVGDVIDQLEEVGYKTGANVRVIPLGKDVTAVIHVVSVDVYKRQAVFHSWRFPVLHFLRFYIRRLYQSDGILIQQQK